MAERFVTEATNTLSPIYDQQIAGIESQVPAIQKLYQTLTDSLRTQNQAQIDTGTQNIVEDASARGVLRSTLPVDARQSLISTLGAALNQSLGQIGLQQTQDIGRIKTQAGELRTKKVTDIASLANTLGSNDLERQKFEFSKQESAQNFALEKQKLAIQRAAASAKSTGFNPAIATSIDATLSRLVGKDGKVSPDNFSQAKTLWVSQGGAAADFNNIFGPKYAEGATTPIQQYYGGGNK